MSDETKNTSNKQSGAIPAEKNQHQNNKSSNYATNPKAFFKKGNSKLGLTIAITAIILAALAAILGVINTRHFVSLQKERSQLNALWQDQHQAQEKELAEFQIALQATRQKQSQQLNQIETNSKNLAKLYDNGTQIHEDITLYETEYLLRIANLTLIQQQNIPTTLALLASADERLHRLNDPALAKVRAAIAIEITDLKAVPKIDITGIYNELNALIRQIPQLPTFPVAISSEVTLETQRNEPENQVNLSWQERFSKSLDDLGQLIIIRRHNQAVKPLLPPEQLGYLEQNLRLMLQQTQWALLQGKQDIYQNSIQQAIDWIREYFNPHDATTEPMLAKLTELEQIEIKTDLPNINQSLEVLRSVIARSMVQP